MSALTAYLHPKCSTCEQARRWLQGRGVKFEEKDIRTTPPTMAERGQHLPIGKLQILQADVLDGDGVLGSENVARAVDLAVHDAR